MTSGAPNVLLVTVDCLRRDRVSAYGRAPGTTPFLDSLIDNALHCTSAHSASSWTCPSVVSLLTGLYPRRHGAGYIPGEPKNLSAKNLPTKLDGSVPMLADMLDGYDSAAFLGVWNAGLCFDDRFGRTVEADRPAGRLVSQALEWISTRGNPFFAWLHLREPHDPLEVPRGLRRTFGPTGVYRKTRRWAYTRASDEVRGEEFRAYRIARERLYDAAVLASDRAIRQLWDGLNGSVRDRTILVLTADHGEEMWEHRSEELARFADPRSVFGVGHGHNLFQELLLVPLILTGPGIEPRHIEENVSLVDLVPTLLAATERNGPVDLDGESLLSPVQTARPIFAEAIAYGHEKKTVISGDRKLLSSPLDEYEEVFALGTDRTESPTADAADRISVLRELLPGGPGKLGETVEATPEIIEHLRGLGYVE